MPIIRMRPRERTKSRGWSWPAGVAGTRMSPSPAPVAALPAATWWVSLWVSTPATTPGSSPGSVPGARPGGVCHHDDAPSSWWARRSGPSRQDVDGAPPSSYQVTWGPDRRRCAAGRPGRGQTATRADPRGRQSNSGSHAPAGQALTFSTSKSATKALRGGIGREEKRGIPTILLARPDLIGAFVADLDKRRYRGPRGEGGRPPRRGPRRRHRRGHPCGGRSRTGRAPRSTAPAPRGRRPARTQTPRPARSSLNPRDRRVTHENVC